MSHEFVDVTVRMKSEHEAAFRQAISRLPQYAVIGSASRMTPEELKPVPEMSWEEELVDLRATVSEVKEALARKDEIALRGFRRLNDLARVNPHEEFAKRMLSVLERSVSEYEMFKERPGIQMPRRVFKYREIGGALTPRYVRLAIGLFALDGKEIDKSDVLEREGTGKNMFYQYVSNLQISVCRLLKR